MKAFAVAFDGIDYPPRLLNASRYFSTTALGSHQGRRWYEVRSLPKFDSTSLQVDLEVFLCDSTIFVRL